MFKKILVLVALLTLLAGCGHYAGHGYSGNYEPYRNYGLNYSSSYGGYGHHSGCGHYGY